MSIKSKVANGFLVVASSIGLSLRKLFLTRIFFHPISMVSLKTCIKTDNHGKIRIGKMVGIRPNTEISANGGLIYIGNNCFINRNAMIVAHEKIEIKDGTTIGPNVCIYDHDHGGVGGYNSAPVTIGKNVWIGANCVILKGLSIGENSVIGAGSTITKDVPKNSVLIQKRDTTIIKCSD